MHTIGFDQTVIYILGIFEPYGQTISSAVPDIQSGPLDQTIKSILFALILRPAIMMRSPQ